MTRNCICRPTPAEKRTAALAELVTWMDSRTIEPMSDAHDRFWRNRQARALLGEWMADPEPYDWEPVTGMAAWASTEPVTSATTL